jgi:hypothetical protein
MVLARHLATTRFSSPSQFQFISAFPLRMVLQPTSNWDLGPNTGLFSRITSDNMGIPTVALDGVPATEECNYTAVVDKNETHLLPIIVAMANPNPKIGSANSYRTHLPERAMRMSSVLKRTRVWPAYSRTERVSSIHPGKRRD